MQRKNTNRTSSRHLSAIMFTDMVGYSAITQENEQLALELLEEHRDILREHFNQCQGREIDTIGDGFFIEFVSALEAVQCAVEIQKSLHQRNQQTESKKVIRVRIGIHVGDVVSRDSQVIGDCVNIAARLEPLAEPGGICFSEDVMRQIINKIDLPIKDLGKEKLKNIRMPMNIYKIVLPWEKSVKVLGLNKRHTFKPNSTVTIFIVALFLIVVFSIYFLDLRIPTVNLFNNSSYSEWPLNRIAVLPFANYSPDQNDAYIADGLTEEIITVLSKIENLDVVARTSVMKYKNEEKDIAEIAKALNVGIVLEGSVRKDKNRIRATAQLIKAQTQGHLWAETYDEKLDHIFELQNDVAFKIAEALQITLLDIEKSKIEERPTHSIEAYNAYLKGRYHWNMRTPDQLTRGMEYFEMAITEDPGYALAYTGMADSYHLLCSYGALPPKVGFPKAKEAALKSINLNENLAEGYNSLAAINLLYDWNWEACERNFKKALELNAKYVQAYLWYALYLQVHKKFEQAEKLIHKAIKLDPLSAIARTDLGQLNYFAGKYKQAIAEYQKSLQLDSSYVYTYAYLGQAYAMNNQLAAAEESFTTAVQLTSGQDPATLAGLAYVYALRGKKEQARSIIDQLTEPDLNIYVHPVYISIIYGALGETDAAIEWLGKGFDDRSEWMIYLQVEHMFQPLNETDEFKKFIRKMNFQD